MEFDDATKLLGQVGKYQRIVFFCVGLGLFQVTFSFLGIVFTAGVPDHWCQTPELDHLNLTQEIIRNVTIPLVEGDDGWSYSSCKRYAVNYSDWTIQDVDLVLGNTDRSNHSLEDCPNGWFYDKSLYLSTIVSEWDLVCDRANLRAVSSTVFMSGLMVGAIFISILSDLFGRRPTFLSTTVASSILMVALSFAPNYTVFCVMRFFMAICNISVTAIGFISVLELFGPEYRLHAVMLRLQFWPLAYVTITPFAVYIRDWFTLNLVCSIVFVFPAMAAFFVPESPRWLYVKGKKDRGDAIIRKASKVNKVTLPDPLDIVVQKSGRGHIWDLFRTVRMALRTLTLSFIWIVNVCVYFGLTLNTSNLGGNIYLNFALSGFLELPSNLMAHLSFQYVGRRLPFATCMIVGGVVLLCILAVPYHMNWLVVTLAMVGKFFTSAAFTMSFPLTTELYPTCVRTMGLGFNSFSGRIGGIISPLINQLNVFSRVIPLTIIAAMSLVGGFLALTLPETKGQSLPETLEDGEQLGRKAPNKKALKVEVTDDPKEKMSML